MQCKRWRNEGAENRFGFRRVRRAQDFTVTRPAIFDERRVDSFRYVIFAPLWIDSRPSADTVFIHETRICDSHQSREYRTTVGGVRRAVVRLRRAHSPAISNRFHRRMVRRTTAFRQRKRRRTVGIEIAAGIKIESFELSVTMTLLHPLQDPVHVSSLSVKSVFEPSSIAIQPAVLPAVF